MEDRGCSSRANRWWIATMVFFVALVGRGDRPMPAQPPPSVQETSDQGMPEAAWTSGSQLEMPINLAMPTLGGMQFWTDHRWWKGWKIQQHATTGHWRLIDPLLVRRAWGPLENCEATLREAMEAEPHQPAEHVTILLHGLMRTSRSMSPLANSLKEQRPGEMICFEYASTRASIDRHAEAFRNLVESLEGTPTMDLAAHSMGNIVVRRAIFDWRRPGGDPKRVLPRLRSMVMLGPPNQGATIAKQLGRLELFGWITGRGGMELGPKWDDLSRKLSTPPFPFAVVAGKLDPRIPQNPLVEGASDFVVSVEETKLEGMTDFLEVPCLHSFLMDDPRVQQQVAHFMQHHSFSPVNNAVWEAPGG
jgi:hypothetical protein